MLLKALTVSLHFESQQFLHFFSEIKKMGINNFSKEIEFIVKGMKYESDTRHFVLNLKY